MKLVIEAIAKVYIPERVRELCEGDWLVEQLRQYEIQSFAYPWQAVVDHALQCYPTMLSHAAWKEFWNYLDIETTDYVKKQIAEATKVARQQLRDEMREWNDRYPMRCPDRRDGC